MAKTDWFKKGPMGQSGIREIKHAYHYLGYDKLSKNAKKNVAAFNKQYNIASNRMTNSKYFPEQKMVNAKYAKFGKAAPSLSKGAKLLGGVTPGVVVTLGAEGIYKGYKRATGPGGKEFHTKKSKNKYGTKGY